MCARLPSALNFDSCPSLCPHLADAPNSDGDCHPTAGGGEGRSEASRTPCLSKAMVSPSPQHGKQVPYPGWLAGWLAGCMATMWSGCIRPPAIALLGSSGLELYAGSRDKRKFGVYHLQGPPGLERRSHGHPRQCGCISRGSSSGEPRQHALYLNLSSNDLGMAMRARLSGTTYCLLGGVRGSRRTRFPTLRQPEFGNEASALALGASTSCDGETLL